VPYRLADLIALIDEHGKLETRSAHDLSQAMQHRTVRHRPATPIMFDNANSRQRHDERDAAAAVRLPADASVDIMQLAGFRPEVVESRVRAVPHGCRFRM